MTNQGTEGHNSKRLRREAHELLDRLWDQAAELRWHGALGPLGIFEDGRPKRVDQYAKGSSHRETVTDT